MKKIYNYHTKELINESDNSKERLYEGLNFRDIMMSAREIRTNNDLQKVVFSPSQKPLAIWEFRGNGCAKVIVSMCDELDLDYCIVSGRQLRGNASALANGESFIIVDDFAFGDPRDVMELLSVLEEVADENQDNLTNVICIGKLDVATEKHEAYVNVLSNDFINFNYVPQAEDFDDEDEDDEYAYESVSDKFAKYRKLYESDDESSDEGNEDNGEEGGEDNADNSDEGGEDNGEEGGEDNADDDTEDVPMTAIILTVKKDDVDKCKEELVDAGIPEDAITDIEGEEDDENGKIKVDADYAIELKDYLKGKGIDLEEKIGGEIVDDSEEGGDKENKEGDEENKEGEEGGDEDGLDFDSEFGDLFGDDEESAE